jgi:hypothetical protein
VPKKSDFWEKSDFSNRVPKSAQEIRFLGKIGFLKPCAQKCPRNPIFGKNRISQIVPKVPKISDFWEKSDFSNRVPKSAQEIRFLGKIGFLKPCPRCPRNPIFGKNRISFEKIAWLNFRALPLVHRTQPIVLYNYITIKTRESDIKPSL